MLKSVVRNLRAQLSRARSVTPFSSFEERLKWDALPKPHYAYGTYHAARTASVLGLRKMSVIEFGVAGGAGLIALESIATEVSRIAGVDIEVYGFDLGEGLSAPVDYRDAPYVWEAGYYKMDRAALERRLKQARLIIGNVKDTVPSFVKSCSPAPIGFISWDLDYYSSTSHALRLLDEPHEFFLPRVYMYFDDIVGKDFELHCEFTGELLAINEFNESHEMIKIAPINGLQFKRRIPDQWNIKMFSMHRFEHPEYNRPLRFTKPQFPIE